MYKELFSFIGSTVSQKSIWKDGEIWTALLGGIASGIWYYNDPDVIVRIRSHFTDLLQATSIIFGFVLTALFFHIEAAGTWKSDKRIERVTTKLISWHVWTVLCMLFLIAYVIALWAVEPGLLLRRTWR